MMNLEEKRGQVQAELDELHAQLHELKERLFDESSSTAASAPALRATNIADSYKVKSAAPKASTAPKSSNKGSAKRAPRGALRDQIMNALEAAGSAGIQVKELAAAMGTKAVNIHSWFHSSIKRNPSITKITGGHYRLEGSGSKSSKTAASQPAQAQSTSRKASAPSRSPKRQAKGGSRRGELSSNILATLKSAGPSGITVKELADKVGAKYKNIYIWFATTGKKNPSVKKVGPAQYRLA